MREMLKAGRKFLWALALVGVAGIGSLTGGCDDDEEFDRDDFIVFDTDGDGMVESGEWNALFDQWDLNRDGMLARQEFLLDHGFETLDDDDDLLLTRGEFEDAFDEFDIDDDDFLDFDELF